MVNKKITLIIAGVLAVGAISLSVFAVSKNSDNNSNTEQVTSQQESTQSDAITFSNDGKTVSYKGIQGETALVTLQSLTTVETKQSDFGDFITAINGVQADGTSAYWAFYVNGSYANEGAGTYIAKDGDTIEFKVEEVTL